MHQSYCLTRFRSLESIRYNPGLADLVEAKTYKKLDTYKSSAKALKEKRRHIDR